MGRRKKNRQPIEVRLDRLHPKGVLGEDAEGKEWRIRRAPVGALVRAFPGRKRTANRIEIIEAPSEMAEPRCELFGLCGGCQLQEMPLSAQRREKQRMVEGLVGSPSAPIRGAEAGYGYRNKIELSFGTRRFLPEERRDEHTEGSWLGFHPPGWFSKVVEVENCPLASEGINQAIAEIVRDLPAPAWSSHTNSGHWRHIVFREGTEAQEGATVSVGLVTHSATPEGEVVALAERLMALPVVAGVRWLHNDGLAEVAAGEEVRRWGDSTVRFSIDEVQLGLPPEAFFQVNSEGARVLFQTIREALGEPGGATLVDLYCGVGAIGLVLASGYRRVVGVELIPEAIEVARANAAQAGIESEWHAGKVEEVLPKLELDAPRHVVVDPPRAGLHPKAAAFVAGLEAEVLVYVACSPASLARDRALLEEGGWSLERLWTVDLFPQTLHVEAVARFVRSEERSHSSSSRGASS